MDSSQTELEHREKIAREAIANNCGSENDEYGATLFVSHHLQELDPLYWKSRLGTPSPSPAQVLDMLVLRPAYLDDKDLNCGLDFTLPCGVTDYVICVRFDEDGEIGRILMES